MMLQSEKPFSPDPVMVLPRKPPRNAPTIPISIVTMIPPGSRPGISAFAIAPATSPSTIQARMVISTPPEGWVCTVQVKQPAYQTWAGNRGLGSNRESGMENRELCFGPAESQSLVSACFDGARRPRRRSVRESIRRPPDEAAASLRAAVPSARVRIARAPRRGRGAPAGGSGTDAACHRRRNTARRYETGGAERSALCCDARLSVRLHLRRDDADQPPWSARHARSAHRDLRAFAATLDLVLRPQPGGSARDASDVRRGVAQRAVHRRCGSGDRRPLHAARDQ